MEDWGMRVHVKSGRQGRMAMIWSSHLSTDLQQFTSRHVGRRSVSCMQGNWWLFRLCPRLRLCLYLHLRLQSLVLISRLYFLLQSSSFIFIFMFIFILLFCLHLFLCSNRATFVSLECLDFIVHLCLYYQSLPCCMEVVKARKRYNGGCAWLALLILISLASFWKYSMAYNFLQRFCSKPS